MKIIKSSIIICLLAVLFAGCNKEKLSELNNDTKNPTDVSGEYLLSNAEQNLSDQIASTNVNNNIYKLWAQYWTETTYPDEAQWNITKRNVPRSVWSVFYRDVLSDLSRAKELINAQTKTTGLPADELNRVTSERDNKLAIIDVLMVYTYQRLVDTFGNIPYSQALDIAATTTPAYDDAETIYQKLFDRLDQDIAMMDPSFDSFTPEAEYIYNGDVASWVVFANSLKFKMAVHVMDVPSLDPGGKAQAALTAGIISSVLENARYPYSTVVPNTNPLWEDLVASGRDDFVGANTFIDTLNSLGDPRLPYFFDGNLTDGSGDPIYIGGVYGARNGYDTLTQVSLVFRDPTYENRLIDYTEMQFYLAEARASGIITTGNAVDYYNEGVKSSILFWGGTDAEATTYLATVPYDDANWRMSIGVQEWISFYSRGFEGWTTIRRLDLVENLNVPPGLGLEKKDYPVRFTYPVEEQTLNGANYSQAAAAIGGDSKTTKLFWDKY